MSAPVASDADSGEKPLFVPLAERWYRAFEDGSKTSEFRRLGPRWNERTCRIGRAVTLSCGYGKSRRMHGVVEAFRVVGPTPIPTSAWSIPTRIASPR